MDRIWVVGSPGVGKTTLAQRLADYLSYPFIELDALFWRPNWTTVEPEIFRARVQEAIRGECWTLGGNYTTARDLIWARADTVVWLDYSLPVALWRLMRRTVRRIRTQEQLWAGNRETWRHQFLSRKSLIYFALRTHFRRRRTMEQLLAQTEDNHVALKRFRSPRATDAWLAGLPVQPTQI